jgi:hypothetical protein
VSGCWLEEGEGVDHATEAEDPSAAAHFVSRADCARVQIVVIRGGGGAVVRAARQWEQTSNREKKSWTEGVVTHPLRPTVQNLFRASRQHRSTLSFHQLLHHHHHHRCCCLSSDRWQVPHPS